MTLIVSGYRCAMVVPITRGLRFVTDDELGICRTGHKRLRYVDETTQERVRDAERLERIRSIAIPPAWTDVWISADPDGHVQATGRDARGRKQYRYHPDFRAERERTKFDDLVPFGESLGGLRRTLDGYLAGTGLTYERVVALVVSLLEFTHLRVGNECYVASNGTCGLTTLSLPARNGARVHGGIKFSGKGGRRHDVALTDPLGWLVRSCQDLPGQLLFQWEDDHGIARPVTSTDVNDYLRFKTGLKVTAKTFRRGRHVAGHRPASPRCHRRRPLAGATHP